ncbi:MAG: MerR family transcriptional regulator [Pseudomonadota bacterium]
MFRIGQFSHLARVSVRQLRFYDEIGLLSPAHVDASSGYRYYTAAQLQRLNEILALKRLGLTLEQIAAALREPTDIEELRELLQHQREQAQALIAEQEARFRELDTRLRQLERRGALADYDIVLKPGLQQWLTSFTQRFRDVEHIVMRAQEFARAAKRQLPRNAIQHLVIAYEDEGFDLEDVTLEDGTTARVRPIRDPQALLTMVRSGTPDLFHPGVRHSEAVRGRECGTGAERMCHTYDGQSFHERLIESDEGRWVVQVLAGMPARHAQVEISATPVDARVTTLRFVAQFDFPFPMSLMSPLIRRRFAKLLDQLIVGLGDHLETGREVGKNGTLGGPIDPIGAARVPA